jgi:YidC/Oxa1 family membrane protein insertase
MEEKKFDVNSLIGFVLLGAIMMWYFYTNQPTPEELAKQKTERVQDSIQKTQQVLQENTTPQETTTETIDPTDSTTVANAQTELGVFAYGATLPSAKANETIIENNLLKIKVANKGGQITEVELKNFKTHDSLPLYLIKNNNASFNLNFGTTDNRILNTKDLFFEPTLSKSGDNQVLSMKLKVANNRY